MASSEYSPLATHDPEEQSGFTLPPNRVVRQRQGRPSHGSVVILHVAFKLIAVLLYLLPVHSFITTFILVTLLLSVDFWVVKNICGRLLAGLRWWSIVNDEGELQWKYESWSNEERAMARQGETTFFWIVLAVAEFLWILLATIALFTCTRSTKKTKKTKKTKTKSAVLPTSVLPTREMVARDLTFQVQTALVAALQSCPLSQHLQPCWLCKSPICFGEQLCGIAREGWQVVDRTSQTNVSLCKWHHLEKF